MNRKRFVKYLMGKGLPRNKAELFAAALNESKIPYHSCQVDNVVKLSNGSYSGTCLFPKAIAQMLIPKESVMLETGLSAEDVMGFLQGKVLNIGETVPVSRIKFGLDRSELRDWSPPAYSGMYISDAELRKIAPEMFNPYTGKRPWARSPYAM